MRRALAVALAVLLPHAGCATVLQGAQTNVTVSTNAQGAIVLVDGVPAAGAPAIVPVESRSSHMMVVRAPGYTDFPVPLQSQTNVGWVILDLLLAFPTLFLTVIIDASSGAWNTLSPTSVMAALQPAGQPVIGVGTGQTLQPPPGYGPVIVEQR